MAPLIDKEKLKRAKGLKKERIELILAAGLRAFTRFAYVDVTLDSIRKMAGVPQGKPELYFECKEELFLQVFTAEVGAWFAELEELLTRDGGELSRGEVADLLFESLVERSVLLRMFGLLHIVLEQNIGLVSGVVFVRKLQDWMARCAELLAARCPALDESSGFDLLYRLQRYGATLYSVAYPSGPFCMMVQDDDLVRFQVDYEPELKALIERSFP